MCRVAGIAVRGERCRQARQRPEIGARGLLAPSGRPPGDRNVEGGAHLRRGREAHRACLNCSARRQGRSRGGGNGKGLARGWTGAGAVPSFRDAGAPGQPSALVPRICPGGAPTAPVPALGKCLRNRGLRGRWAILGSPTNPGSVSGIFILLTINSLTGNVRHPRQKSTSGRLASVTRKCRPARTGNTVSHRDMERKYSIPTQPGNSLGCSSLALIPEIWDKTLRFAGDAGDLSEAPKKKAPEKRAFAGPETAPLLGLHRDAWDCAPIGGAPRPNPAVSTRKPPNLASSERHPQTPVRWRRNRPIGPHLRDAPGCGTHHCPASDSASLRGFSTAPSSCGPEGPMHCEVCGREDGPHLLNGGQPRKRGRPFRYKPAHGKAPNGTSRHELAYRRRPS